jgi:hypothetical protein
MDQLPTSRGGGDTRTPQAKLDSARREEQIVLLRLRKVPYSAIARAVGVSKTAVVRAFERALHRNTDTTIGILHRTEAAELDYEQGAAWNIFNAHPEKPELQLKCLQAVYRCHQRRAKLFGLDAPAKIDINAFYNQGSTEMSAERLANQAVWQAMPVAEQIRIFEAFNDAKKRLAEPAVVTSAQGISGPNDAEQVGVGSSDATPSDPPQGEPGAGPGPTDT